MVLGQLIDELLKQLADGTPPDTLVYTGVAGSRPVRSVEFVINDERLGTPGEHKEVWIRP